MNVILDDGFLFGLGAFETMAVYGSPIFLEKHLERLERALEFLGISQRVTEDEVYWFLNKEGMAKGALKIVVSEKNKLFLPRKNPYREQDYKKGFHMDFARTRQNEDSPFTYHKTMNYGGCILEKRWAAGNGLDEMIFLNGRGEICEGTSSNIFFVREGKIFTPETASGLLPGVMRSYILENYEVLEQRIAGGEAGQFEECFVTNSLMGIMPVVQLGRYCFENRKTADKIRRVYLETIFSW